MVMELTMFKGNRPTNWKRPLIKHGADLLRKHGTSLVSKLNPAEVIMPGISAMAVDYGVSFAEGMLNGDGTMPKGRGRPSGGGGRTASPKAPVGFQVNTPASGGTSSTKFVARRKGKVSRGLRDALKSAQRGIFETTNSFVVSAADGYQGIGTPASMTNASTYPYAAAVANGSVEISGSFKDGMLTSVRNLFSTDSSAYFYLQDVIATTTVYNNSKSPAKMRIYELTAKHDVSSYGTSEISGINVMDPSAYWAYGLADETDAASTLEPGVVGGTSARILQTFVGAQPKDSPLFNVYWKVSGWTDVELAVGSTHIHRSHYKYNIMVASPRLANSALLQGVTRTIMIVASGGPVYSTTSTQPEFGSVNLLTTTEYRAVGYSMANSRVITEMSFPQKDSGRDTDGANIGVPTQTNTSI